LKDRNKYLTQIDDFRLVQDKVYQEMNTIVKEYIQTNDSDFSKNMNYFYESAKNLNSVESSRKLIKNIVNKIDEIRMNKNNLWKLLAYINKNEIISSVSPFKFSVKEDRKEPNIVSFTVILNHFTS
jgi:predicted metalloendopeptidase